MIREATPGAGPWSSWLLAAAGIGMLALLSGFLRPLLPVDETRYIGVAWEMWQRGDFLIPHLNGAAYDHKPPVLFWLIHAGWFALGVNEWWPRVIGPLSTLLALALIARLGTKLWPQQSGVGSLGALMFAGTWYIAPYQTALMFDMPLLAAIAWSWCALVDASATRRATAWVAFGASVGLGALIKGPVVLVYTLPAALGMRWWTLDPRKPGAWKGLPIALATALAIPAAWLAAAWFNGDADYFHRLLIDQTMNRVNGAMGHPRPIYWYLPVIVLLAMPWVLWLPAWRGARLALAAHREPGTRFVVLVFGAGFGVLSLVSGKQVHYLIPLLALLSLLLARGLYLLPARPGTIDRWAPALAATAAAAVAAAAALQWPSVDRSGGTSALILVAPVGVAIVAGLLSRRGATPAVQAQRIAATTFVTLAVLMVIVLPQVRATYSLEAAAEHVAAAQSAGRDVLFVGNYQGEFGFFGRLSRPVAELSPHAAGQWIARHPRGLVVARSKRLCIAGSPTIEFRQPYKTDQLLMLGAADLTASGSFARDPEWSDNACAGPVGR